ncbi:MAG: cation diffusion facilitator family transporter [Mycobacteriales bacterium]
MSTSGERALDRRLTLAVVANLAVVGAQFVTGLAADSLSLIADAAHNLTDVGALSLALWAVRAGRREPTGRKSFGWHRGSVLAAQANAAAILVLAALLANEALRRFDDPPQVRGGIIVAMAALAAIVNALSALLLARHTGELGTRSAFVHLIGDAGASVAVGIAGAAILITGGNQWLDPAATLLIAALLLVAAWRLLQQTAEVLLESTPAGMDSADVTATIMAVPGVESAHDLHVWSLSSEVHALSVHVVVAGHPSLEEAQRVGTAVKAAVSAPYRIAHATVELECEGCVDDGGWCAISPAVLSREAGRLAR